MKKISVLLLFLTLVPIAANALTTDEILALVAMPLAVAAVSEVSGVPQAELASLVATLNNANVAPAQVIEVVRYVPVALVVENQQPDFVQFVQQQTTQGVTGPALVTVIEQRLRTIDPEINFVRTQPTIVVDETFVPVRVRERVAKVKAHPHGGPPGQVKKELGLQTGAEVVHGTRPGVVAVPRPMVSSVDDDKGKGKGKGKEKVSGEVRSGRSDDSGKGKGHGKGQGKGKGKD